MFLTVNQDHPSRLRVNVVKTCVCGAREKNPGQNLEVCLPSVDPQFETHIQIIISKYHVGKLHLTRMLRFE
jgi:hypothetical protein